MTVTVTERACLWVYQACVFPRAYLSAETTWLVFTMARSWRRCGVLSTSGFVDVTFWALLYRRRVATAASSTG